jgi:hypothetical protein
MTGDEMATAFLERCKSLRLHRSDAEAVQEVAKNIKCGYFRFDPDRQMLITPSQRIKICSGFDPVI